MIAPLILHSEVERINTAETAKKVNELIDKVNTLELAITIIQKNKTQPTPRETQHYG